MNAGWPAATVQYRLNLAHALHSISPTLSALHASRAAALHPEASAILQPSHCSKCGTYHFSGDHPSHLVGPSTRRKRRRATPSLPKVLQRKCYVCSLSIDACPSSSLDHSSVSFTPPIKEVVLELPPSDIRHAASGPVQTTSCGSGPPLPCLPKSSRTKTSTLKTMLSRDRQRATDLKSQRERKEAHELGLAVFLKEL